MCSLPLWKSWRARKAGRPIWHAAPHSVHRVPSSACDPAATPRREPGTTGSLARQGHEKERLQSRILMWKTFDSAGWPTGWNQSFIEISVKLLLSNSFLEANLVVHLKRIGFSILNEFHYNTYSSIVGLGFN